MKKWITILLLLFPLTGIAAVSVTPHIGTNSASFDVTAGTFNDLIHPSCLANGEQYWSASLSYDDGGALNNALDADGSTVLASSSLSHTFSFSNLQPHTFYWLAINTNPTNWDGSYLNSNCTRWGNEGLPDTPNGSFIINAVFPMPIINTTIASMTDSFNSILPKTIPTIIIIIVLFTLLHWILNTNRQR